MLVWWWTSELSGTLTPMFRTLISAGNPPRGSFREKWRVERSRRSGSSRLWRQTHNTTAPVMNRTHVSRRRCPLLPTSARHTLCYPLSRVICFYSFPSQRPVAFSPAESGYFFQLQRQQSFSNAHLTFIRRYEMWGSRFNAFAITPANWIYIARFCAAFLALTRRILIIMIDLRNSVFFGKYSFYIGLVHQLFFNTVKEIDPINFSVDNFAAELVLSSLIVRWQIIDRSNESSSNRIHREAVRALSTAIATGGDVQRRAGCNIT